MVNKLRSDPGKVAQLNTDPNISLAVPSAAVDTGQAWQVLAGVAGNLSNRLGKIADDARARETVIAAAEYMNGMPSPSGAAYLQAKAVNNAAAGAAMQGPWQEQAKAILRKEEGFKETPYWDVNAHRVGYGSDTTTGADGKPVKVQQGMTITRDQAEADLNYRLTQREGATVQKQLGPAWDALPDTAKAVMASVGYNYGSLPDNVVAAAKTGDLQQLSAAVGGLSANPGRRKREASLILSAAGEAPASSTPSTQTDNPKPEVSPLSTVPLALRRDGTISGNAWDAAVSSSYAWRVQEGIANDLGAAFIENQNDPQKFAEALADVRHKYASDPNLSDPLMQEMFNKSFTQQSNAYVLKVAQQREASTRQEQLASFADGITSAQIDLERQAMLVGASPEGDGIVSERVNSLNSSIDAAVKSATITPTQANKYKRDIAETAITGRIQGAYDALPTPEAKQQYALEILGNDKNGYLAKDSPLAIVPYPKIKALSDKLWNDATQRGKVKTVEGEQKKQQLSNLIDDDVALIASKGTGLTSDSGLTADEVERTLGPTEVAKWNERKQTAQKVYTATNGMEIQSEAAIQQRLAQIKPKENEPGYADDLKIYEAAQKRAEALLTARREDPLEAAKEAGLVPLQQIDASSTEALSQSMALRDQQGKLVANIYGGEPALFTKNEIGTLKGTMLSTDQAKQTVVMTQLDFMANARGPAAVRHTFNEDTLSRLQDWQARVRYDTPDEAQKWLQQRNDPQWQERVKPLISKGETEARKLSFDDVASSLDKNWIFGASEPPDGQTQRAMMNDFTSLYAERFAVTQDKSVAKKQALERMQKVWGTTSAMGGMGGRMMLYPPESYYPAVENGHGYIQKEVEDIAKAQGVSAKSLALVSDKKTEAAVERGEAPGYLISKTDPKTGLDDLVTDDKGRPLRHFFDPAAARNTAMANAEEARRTRNDPWITLGDGTALGPLYMGGADPADLAQRAQRMKEIPAEQKQRRDAYEQTRQQLPWPGIDTDVTGGQ